MSTFNLDRLRPGKLHCPSDLALDRLVADVMPAAEKRATLAHLEVCEDCADRIEILRDGFAAFPAVSEERLLASIEARLAATRATNTALAFLCQFAHRNPYE